MAGRTLANRAGVIHGGRCKRSEISVAGVASAGGRNVRTGLGQALVRRSVVTTVTTMVTNNSRWRQL